MAFAVGCGGSVDSAENRPGVAAGDGATSSVAGGASGQPDAGAATGGTSGFGSGGAAGIGGTFIDPGCPDAMRVAGPSECDALATDTGCGFGQRCLPTVEYAEDCGTEVFGTVCVEAGSGAQGDDCVDEPCSEHHVCVTTGQGSQCVRLCALVAGGDDCAPGLLCQALDVDGYNVCF